MLKEYINNGYIFNPTVLTLDESFVDWNGMEDIDGSGFVKRCALCEFHHKQKVNRRLRDSIFSEAGAVINFAKLHESSWKLKIKYNLKMLWKKSNHLSERKKNVIV